jgi:agmatinase
MKSVYSTFCGVPACDSSDIDASVAIFGAADGTPYRHGQSSHAGGAPAAIRGALDWFSVSREQYDFDVQSSVMGIARIVDCGDVETDPKEAVANRKAIRGITSRLLARGIIPLLLGGDDSTPIPVIDAFSETGRPLTILQIDAHIDWRNEIDGERYGYSSTMRRASEMSHVTKIIQAGARGPGSARRADYEDAVRWGAHIVPMREIFKEGLAGVLDSVVSDSDVFLSIDVDGIDPSVVPGVILPAFGGLTYQQVLALIEGVAAKARIVGGAFVEYVPNRDPSGFGAKAIARLACCLIAHAGGRAPA